MTAAAFGLAALGLLVGVGLGVLLERSHFCTMGAVADVVLFGSWRRARVWCAMVAASVGAIQGLALFGWPGIATLVWPAFGAVGALVGGSLFGLGMVLAGGCASRLWVRAGAGSAKALLALVAMAAAGGLTVAIAEPGAIHPRPPELAAAGRAAAILASALVLIGVAVRGAIDRTAAALVAAVVLGWLAVAADLGATTLNFQPTLPVAMAGWSAAAPSLAVPLGVLLGAGVAAARTGRFGGERIVDADDLRRHLLGGVAMGIGGTLAGGCTLGAGVGGMALLAPAAVAALLGMVAGAAWMVHVLACGGWRAAWRALRP